MGGRDAAGPISSLPPVIPQTLRLLLPDGAVGEVDLEDFVAGVVSAAMGPDAPFEALKAQAVAARTLAVVLRRHAEADTCATRHCQQWNATPHAAAVRAAFETRGTVALYHGALIHAYYFEHCDGKTRESKGMLVEPAPYCRSVECPCGFATLRGHGLGMCKEGALVKARRGQSYIDILEHYYTGIELVQTAPPVKPTASTRREDKASPPEPSAQTGSVSVAQPASIDLAVPPFLKGRTEVEPPAPGPRKPIPFPRTEGVRAWRRSAGAQAEASATPSTPESTNLPAEKPARSEGDGAPVPKAEARFRAQGVVSPVVTPPAEVKLDIPLPPPPSRPRPANSPLPAAAPTTKVVKPPAEVKPEITPVQPAVREARAPQRQPAPRSTGPAAVPLPPLPPVASPLAPRVVTPAREVELPPEYLAQLERERLAPPAPLSIPERLPFEPPPAPPTVRIAPAPPPPTTPEEMPVSGPQAFEAHFEEPETYPEASLPDLPPTTPEELPSAAVVPPPEGPEEFGSFERGISSMAAAALAPPPEGPEGWPEVEAGQALQPAPPPVPAEWVRGQTDEVFLDYVPGPRRIVGDLGEPGIVITVREPEGHTRVAVSGSATQYGAGGFEIPLPRGGDVQIEFQGRRVPVTVGEETLFLTFPRPLG